MIKPVCRADILDTDLSQDRRLLLFGPPGVGKSTLVAQLAQSLFETGRTCWCVSADPGSPSFGVPGAVSLGIRRDGLWEVKGMEGLCTLDAGRFRVPLIVAVQRLSQIPERGVLFVDGLGVVRGVAGRELLAALAEITKVDGVLLLTAADRSPHLLDELRALNIEVSIMQAATEAQRPGKKARARTRTAQWDAYLADAQEQVFDLENVNLIGTPPPKEEPSAWVGRQIALLANNKTVSMGEVQRLEDHVLAVRLPVNVTNFDTMIVRDARRTAEGVVETATPFVSGRLDYAPPEHREESVEANSGPRVVGRVGSVDVALLNGVFGDPLLHLRQRHRRRGILFDLGEGGRLPARLAHQVSDVFISHAHFDHIGGFLWLLRSRIGEFPVCRLYGPPGLAKHIAGFMQGILWDRVAERGPCFEVADIFEDYLQRFRITAGIDAIEILDQVPVVNSVLFDDPEFKIRAAILDHKGIPVIAYAFEPAQQVHIRKDRLLARGLEPGLWLTELKRNLVAGNDTALVQLPDGNMEPVAALGSELALISPGEKIVYATDLADTPDNRERLVTLARNAHTFFCESPFLEKDAAQAERTGHLTTHACGEIAIAAGVGRLVPFHFSRRYSNNTQQIYDEIHDVCDRVVIPGSMSEFSAG